MTLDPTSGTDTGSAGDGGTLVFISDASAEAERLSTALRSRGYALFDVPLGLLVSRVAVQKPALVICDADAPGALETIRRVREVGGGQRIDVIFVGEPGRTLELQREELEREASGTFARPVDPEVLTRKVEALIGAPSAPRHGFTGAGRPPVLVAATRRPYRFEGPSSFRPPPAPGSSPSASEATMPPSSPTSSGSLPASSTPPPNPAATPAAPAVTQARLSPELELLLGRAEARIRQVNQTAPVAAERLSPEAELDAILPPDLLAALDEPLDIDEDDEDVEESAAGTAGGSEAESRAGRTGHGSAGGTGTGTGGTRSRALTAAGGSRPPNATPDQALAGEDAEPMEEAPLTPPALRTRNPPPANLRTSFHSADGAREATAAPTAPPPAPSGPPPDAEYVPEEFPSEPPFDDDHYSAPTRPPRFEREPERPAPSVQMPAPKLEVPPVVGPGDAVRALARAVRARFSGALAFEDSSGIRRVVFRDGDFVTAASGAAGESLVEYLGQRGDLSQEALGKLGRRLPQFGRHAGAALIAQGYLRQDELWNVLRAHAEWIVARAAGIDRGGASVEHDVPVRLAAEPGVFGGATGAEVLLDVVRRVVSSDDALKRLGGGSVRLVPGPSHALLSECALSPSDSDWVEQAQALTVAEIVERTGSRDFATVLYVLAELGVLRSSSAAPRAGARAKAHAAVPDVLDDAALRSRIARRRSLVEEGDYFALLGVSREATSYDVRRAYNELRREFDAGRILTPGTADLRDDVELIVEVLEEAYDILSDEVRRERYRRALDASPG